MGDPWDGLSGCNGFRWDEANATKNWERHRVSQSECEKVFFNHPFVVAVDERHSQEESRYYGLGQTDAGRGLFVVFTIRGDLIGVISARDMSRREREAYERTQEGG
jgi:uncharacterized DUF497 family protein